MILAESQPVDWILSALLVLAWLALRVTPRRVPWVWFFATGVILALLCIPAGMIAGRMELHGIECTPDTLCFSIHEVHWWINGLLGFFTTWGLALVTPVVGAVIAAVRRARAREDADTPG